jgi:N-acetylmuramoyl-L-alanine amidase
VQFARTLVTELRSATKLHKEPLKSASFRVLKAPDIPSVLVELGYVTSREDIKSLRSEAWRGRAADAMVRAVDTFFTTRLAGAGRRSGGN